MNKEELIKYWQENKIITDKRVIDAFKKIKREKFIPKELKNEAYNDNPLSIGFGQTISQPTTVMLMTQALEVKEGNKILEIGTGSGYQSSIISLLVGKKGKVYTTEIIKELYEFSKNNLKEYKNVKVFNLDGSKGLEKYKPYDGIIITAACPRVPNVLISQLKSNGIIIAPVGSEYSQEMLKIKKKNNKIETENLGDFIFVQLKGKYGFK
ncbi:protein-L-isoaspartate(D-aspartate) O-methyltransferase [Candidatus Woesearchaeota archaeon]|nr:protein-L-isoaspartate(D-aspartate) O-methyltransferase [Candidatus Woesearchaeota archaeon]